MAMALISEAASKPGQPAGACGKTQLAAHFAGELWRAGQVDFLAWVDASSQASALAGYIEAAATVGIEYTGPAEHTAARLTGWLANTSRPWLIVLDDVRDTADLDGLWPCGPAGRVLLTTRDEQAFSGAPGELPVQAFPIGPFSSREALNYLMGRLAADPDQRHGAIDLVLELGSDPVALTHASAAIATTTQSCADYQGLYADKLTCLETQQAHTRPEATTVTWMLSAERADQLCPGGVIQLLLALTAMVDVQVIPAALFTTSAVCKYLAEAGASAADPDSAWQAVRTLEHTGLLAIDPAPTPPIVRVSRPGAALARAVMSEQVLERAAVTAADALLEIWPWPERKPWIAAGMRSCADALQRTAANSLWTADTCHFLLHKAGHSLDTAGLTGPAIGHWAQLATTSDRILGPGTPHTLTAASQLAHALLAGGQPSQATDWWQWITARHIQVSGPRHPDTLTARMNLGHAMAAAGYPRDAITILEPAVADHEQAHGTGHPETFRARAELAAACQAADRPVEAIGHYRRNLADHERTYGVRHPGTVTACEQLAAACLADGRIKEAIACYETALASRQHTLGPDHMDTITARRNLAAAYQAAGKITTALQLHEQVCADYERVLGARHPHTLACRADLADIYDATGRLADASTLRRDTLTRCDQAPGAET